MEDTIRESLMGHREGGRGGDVSMTHTLRVRCVIDMVSDGWMPSRHIRKAVPQVAVESGKFPDNMHAIMESELMQLMYSYPFSN